LSQKKLKSDKVDDKNNSKEINNFENQNESILEIIENIFKLLDVEQIKSLKNT